MRGEATIHQFVVPARAEPVIGRIRATPLVWPGRRMDAYERRAASSACGVSMSRNAPWPSTGTSATASECFAIK